MALDIFNDIIGAPFNALGVDPSGLPLVGGFFEDPAEKALQDRLASQAGKFEELRPQMADARTQALRQQLTAFGPANRALAAMYGPGAAVDFAPMGMNPMANVFAQPGQPPTPQGAGGGGGAPPERDPRDFLPAGF